MIRRHWLTLALALFAGAAGIGLAHDGSASFKGADPDIDYDADGAIRALMMQ